MAITLGDWLEEEPFTLAMSSGFFGFFAHCGMLCALESRGMLPVRVTGSSAGALIGGSWASGLTAEVIREQLFALTKQDFWDPGLGLGMLRGRRFRALLKQMLACTTLEECRVPVALSAWDGLSRATKVLTNGSLVEAIYASCAVPFLFQPIWINRRPLWDGGIADRSGLAGTSGNERTFYHHIASRSPWRRRNSLSLQIPMRSNLSSLVIHGLPRSGPDKLNLGPFIFGQAYESTQRALDAPLNDKMVVEINVPANQVS